MKVTVAIAFGILAVMEMNGKNRIGRGLMRGKEKSDKRNNHVI